MEWNLHYVQVERCQLSISSPNLTVLTGMSMRVLLNLALPVSEGFA